MAAHETERKESKPEALSQHRMLAASSFVIAASYESMISPPRAIFLYREAAGIYRSMGHPYWMVLAMASADRELMSVMPNSIADSQSPPPQSVAFAMIANQLLERGRMPPSLDSHWRHYGNVPIGRLGIPLDHYGQCARAMHKSDTDREFRGCARSYVERASEIMQAASHDTYHWKRLRSAVLPAEPEVIAMTMAMSMASRRFFERPLTRMADFDGYGGFLVETGEAMRAAAEGEDFTPVAKA